MTSRFTLALFLVGMSPAAAAPRQAAPPDRFDGTWSVEIITETGSCDRAYRYPVRIENGRARFIGTAFVVEGGVTRNGAIRGSISNGAATADVRPCACPSKYPMYSAVSRASETLLSVSSIAHDEGSSVTR